MYFTQEDYKKIENWLHRNSVKDTEFQEALPFTGKEIVTVVQDGHNRKVNIQEFINQLYKHGVEDFLNVTNTYRANNITLKEAIRLIPAEARKEGQVITFLNTDGNWEIYQFIGKLNQWNNSTLWNNPFDWGKFVVDSILPDEEDLTKSEPDAKGNSYLSFKDRKYEPDKYSGLGRKILRRRVVEIEDPIYGTQEKNLLLQADFAEDNTVYVVRYDFTLNGQDITLPDNSYIEYEGGSISDGNIMDRAGGLNRIVLKKNIVNGKNILTQEMVSKSNTIYEIRYDFTLSENVTIPANCVLEFDGGSISDDGEGKNTINGNNCSFNYTINYCVFDNVIIKNFNIPYLDIRWFGAKNDAVFNNGNIISGTDNAQYIQKTLDIAEYYKKMPIKIIGNYLIGDTCYAHSNLNLEGCENPSLGYINETENNFSKSSLIIANGVTAFIADGTSATSNYKLSSIAIDNLSIFGDKSYKTATFIKITASGGPSRPAHINNCRFHYLKYAIHGEVASYSTDGTLLGNLTINSCLATNCEKFIYATGVRTFTNLSIENSTIEHNELNAIYIEGCFGNIIIKNNILEGQIQPIYLRADSNICCIEITDNYFEQTTNAQYKHTIVIISTIQLNCNYGSKLTVCRNSYFNGANVSGFIVNDMDNVYNSAFENCYFKKGISANNIQIKNITGTNLFESFPESQIPTNDITILKPSIKTSVVQKDELINYKSQSDPSGDYDYQWYNKGVAAEDYLIAITRIISTGFGVITFSVGNEDGNPTVSSKFTSNKVDVVALSRAHTGIAGTTNKSFVYIRIDDSDYYYTDFVVYNDKTGILADIPRYAEKRIIGTTRPTNPTVGLCMFDASQEINKPIWWNGTTWIDATGTPV